MFYAASCGVLRFKNKLGQNNATYVQPFGNMDGAPAGIIFHLVISVITASNSSCLIRKRNTSCFWPSIRSWYARSHNICHVGSEEVVSQLQQSFLASTKKERQSGKIVTYKQKDPYTSCVKRRSEKPCTKSILTNIFSSICNRYSCTCSIFR